MPSFSSVIAETSVVYAVVDGDHDATTASSFHLTEFTPVRGQRK